MAARGNAVRRTTAIHTQLANLEEKYQNREAEIMHLRAELASLKENNEILDITNAGLLARQERNARDFTEIDQRIAEAQGEVETLTRVISDDTTIQANEVTESKNEIDRLRVVKDELSREKEKLLMKLAKRELELDAAKPKLERVEKTVSHLTAEKGKCEATLREMTGKLRAFNNANSRIPELTAEIERLRQMLSHARCAVET